MTARKTTTKYTTGRLFYISLILIKEHIRDASSFLWTSAAPCMLYFIVAGSLNSPYLKQAGWFYAYISANVAFFGFSFYLIGRRESGFIRSFIYRKRPMLFFLTAQMISYALMSLFYASLFYLITKPLHGPYSLQEYTFILARFSTSYLGFTLIGLIIASLPLTFATAGTLFSLLSFLMLISSYLGAATVESQHPVVMLLNPLLVSTQLFHGDLAVGRVFPPLVILSITALYLTARHFRIQPVWSRY
ncbi:hypothetical protein [Pseudomonas fulva]|uniref:hypothetical protein n=1 Tax=Pseudomonas fulva TaxID=47880 RepID=UPI0018A89018|nr:hypothetical protein [Pseudomonas fulva]MBF8777244.1 hypothetical protein [Pseudomonas fulva]